MESLYFIALVPPDEIRKDVEFLKLEVKDRFHSKHALNAPVHITLHMPFKWKDKKQDLLFEALEEIASVSKPFQLTLDNFDYFEPRVVFIGVKTCEPLMELQRSVLKSIRGRLKIYNANYKDRPFHPHMTIAFRDLSKKMFFDAKKYFSNRQYRAEFDVESIFLLRHEDKKWHIHREFIFPPG